MDGLGFFKIDSVGTCCSLSNLVMLTPLWDQVHLAYSSKKKQGSANLVIAIKLPFCLYSLEKGAQLAPVRLLELTV